MDGPGVHRVHWVVVYGPVLIESLLEQNQFDVEVPMGEEDKYVSLFQKEPLVVHAKRIQLK